MHRSLLPPLVSLSPAILFLLPGIIVTQEGLWEDYKYGHGDLDNHNFCTWKCLLFTLQWPGAFCQSLNNVSLCRIPPTVNNWTIHGLWPLHAKNRCDCWPMFPSDVQELKAELTELWPSFVRFKSNFHFWRDEWRKHGASAACVEGMNSPLRYFQVCVKLRAQFDIHSLLEDAGITPSCERPYKDRELWFQLKIRLNRNLTVGCDLCTDAEDADSRPVPSPGHPCPDRVPFYYFPINHERPQRPCG
uniref:Ribonuclease T2-like n=1 Tax=Pundamilia nyererei TaxID=303518 RepID=A0A3B4FSI6_9CICH